MPKSSLIKNALNKYKVAPFSSWILCLVTGILIAAILAIDYVVPVLSFLTIPLLVLPIFFTATLHHIVLKNTSCRITVKSSFRGFGLYFRPGYQGCFGFFSALIKSIIVFFIVEMIISSIASYSFMAFSSQFTSQIDALYELLNDSSFSYEQFESILHAENNLLFNFLVICVVPSYFSALTFFFYNISRRSILIYYHSFVKEMNMQFAKIVYFATIGGRRMKMLGDYMLLNWPIYVLMLSGFLGGSVLGYFWKNDLFYIFVTGLIGGTLLSTFFLPFYFANQEAFYEKYHELFMANTTKVSEMMLKNIQNDIELSTLEKERLEQSLPKAPEENKEDDKKDPEGP